MKRLTDKQVEHQQIGKRKIADLVKSAADVFLLYPVEFNEKLLIEAIARPMKINSFISMEKERISSILDFREELLKASSLNINPIKLKQIFDRRALIAQKLTTGQYDDFEELKREYLHVNEIIKQYLVL